MKCSVVILNWNGVDMLRRYLPSVVANTKAEGVEVVVADNGSTDDSLQVVATFPSVRILRMPENHGFAGGYNEALTQIDSEYSVLLNSDVEVTENWLQPLLDYMDCHSDVAAVQPKVLSWTSKEEHLKNPTQAIRFEHAGAAGGYMDILGYPFCRGRVVNYVEEDKGQYDTTTEIFWATGACMCVRTSVYKELGGLDDEFFAHMEEIDLCWRMQCRGYKIACVPQSVVYHLGGGALSYNNPRKTYLNFRNNLLMIYKNAPAKILWRIMLVRFAMDNAAILQMLVTKQKENAMAAFRARKDYCKMRRTASFRAKRKENMEKMIVMFPATIAHRSIVFDFYLRKKRTL